MKITLAVLFLAGLTIYCKCTAVLSLPPSLIAHAASLERTQTQTAATDNGGGGGGGDGGGAEDAGTAVDDDGDTSELYKNAKNLRNKDFRLQKRERNAFEDDIAAVVDAPQTQQRLHHQTKTAIKNNKNVLQQLATLTQQQQQQPHDNGNNNFLKMKSSATNTNYPNAELHRQLANDEDDDDNAAAAAAEEYDSNEWLAPSSQMTDDIIVSPPSPQHKTIEEPDDDDDGDGDGDEDSEDGNDFEPLAIATQLRDFPPNGGLSSLAALDDQPADGSTAWSEFLRPLKYWAKQCQTENENNCPQDYYRALIADRNNAFLKQIHYKQNMAHYVDPLTRRLVAPPIAADLPRELLDASESLATLPKTINNINNDDILLLLTAEQNLAQFLTWAMAELYPLGKFSNVSENGADNYHPGMYIWKKYNLSGRLEPPMFVQEPHYVIVRREYDPDDEYKRGLHYRDDPFIPPRGRKHNLPDLDSLLQRYETFVPNRGRRDKIKDIFKYDDLFYPNRGKRQMRLESTGDRDIKENHQQAQLINGENAAEMMMVAAATAAQLQYPSTKTLEHINNLMAKMKRKLHQMQLQQSFANSFDEMSSNKPTLTRMSTTYQASQSPPTQRLNKRLKSMVNMLQQQRRQHLPNSNKNINARRQWWKRYSTTADDRASATAIATARSRTAATNRLHALRSMSPWQQDSLQAKEYFTPPSLYQASKFMWQQQQQHQHQQPTPSVQQQQSLAQQFDPLSWHKQQMLQHQYHLPLLTTMRHPRLTVAAAVGQQHQHPSAVVRQQQLETPQETQLSYSSDATADNSVANDLKNLFNTDYD